MKNKQIKIGAVISYVSIIVNLLAGLFFTPWMIKKIGQNQYGLYTLANSLITLFLVDFGLSSATARYISRYHAAGDKEAVDNFTGVVYKFYGIIDAVIFAVLTVLYFFLPRIYAGLTPQEMEQFKAVYIIAASFNVINLPFLTLNGILVAYEKFIQLKAADLIYRLLMVSLTIAALTMGMGLYALVSVNALSGLIVVLYKYAVVKTSAKVKANFRYKNRKLFKEIFFFSLWVTVATLAQRLIFNITPSVLGIVAASGAIAVFGVVTTVEGYFYTFSTAIGGMFMPRITRACLDGEENAAERLTPLMINVGRFQFALNGLLVLGFALLGRHFIVLWMGAEYADAYIGILLVTAPGLFYNSLEVANTYMVVKNKVNIQAWIAVGGTFAVPIVVDFCRVVLILSVGELAVRTCHLHAQGGVAGHAEVEALVGKIQVQAESHVRVRVSQVGLVLCGDDPVSVDVHKLQVAGLDVRTLQGVGGVSSAVLVQISLHVGGILYHTFRLVAVEIADGHPFLHAGHVAGVLCQQVAASFDVMVLIVHLGHGVLVVGHIDGDAIREVFAHLVVPVQGQLNAGILYRARIVGHGGESRGGSYGDIDQQVFCQLLVPVEGQAQATVQETGIQSEIQLFRGFPGQFIVGQTGGICTWCSAILVVVVERI